MHGLYVKASIQKIIEGDFVFTKTYLDHFHKFGERGGGATVENYRVPFGLLLYFQMSYNI